MSPEKYKLVTPTSKPGFDLSAVTAAAIGFARVGRSRKGIRPDFTEEQREIAFQKHLATGGDGSNCNLFFNEGMGRFRHFTRDEFFAHEWTVSAWLDYQRQ